MQRPSEAICLNCVLWHRPTQECRAEPPHFEVSDDDFAVNHKGIWPQTDPNDFCGSFNNDWSKTQ